METRTSCEIEHDFALVLDGISDFDEDTMDALFQAGCDDAVASLRFGRVYLTFTRVAPSLSHAILSAIRDVRRANIGASVLRVDDCHLVTQAEIARRSNRSRSIINQYISGKRGSGGFPAPECQITDGKLLWRWCEVAYWLRKNDMIKEQNLVDARDIQLINVILEFMHQKQIDSHKVEELLAEFTAEPVSA